MSAARKFRIFLAALAIVGSLFVYLATSHYGPGVSTDAARYMSTAESLAAGRGDLDYLGEHIINWPPLYPAILAMLKLATGADVFAVGQVINILAFGAIIWLCGLLFERSLPGNYGFAVVASLIVATSLPLIEVSANIASDPLFMICVLLFLLTGQRYTAKPSRVGWWQLAAIAAVSCFLRYAGFALISGGLLLFVINRRNWRATFLQAAAFGLASGLPIAAWAILHNYRLTGSILGSHLASYPWGLFSAAVSKVASWFVPESILRFAPPLALLAALLVLLAVRSSRARWQAWLERVQAAPVFPSAIFFAVYGLMLIFAISYPEHRVAGSQRIHAVLLPMLLVLAAVTAQVFAPEIPRKRATLWRNALLAVFALWLLFPAYRVVVYVHASRTNGDVSYYNLYNTRTLRESDVVAEIQSSDISADQRIYSNNEGAAYFYLRRRIHRLPRYDAELGEELQTAMLTFDGWPADDEAATLIWFKRDLDYKETVPTPEQMSEFIRLNQIWTGRYGIIYLMDVDLEK